jgi:hypothetical protein
LHLLEARVHAASWSHFQTKNRFSLFLNMLYPPSIAVVQASQALSPRAIGSGATAERWSAEPKINWNTIFAGAYNR